MRYVVRKSIVDVLGEIWMPFGAECSLRKTLSNYDIENMRDGKGRITRKSVDHWLTMNAGDFSRVLDFSASIEDCNETIDIPWLSDEMELRYLDTLGEPL